MSSARRNAVPHARHHAVWCIMHCCPAALAPHVEWALAGVLGAPVRLEWAPSPPRPPSARRGDLVGPVGMAARLAASLRAWPMLVFEITEYATRVSDGERLAYVPGRGFHRSRSSVNGDIVVGEERLRGLLSRARIRGGVRARDSRTARHRVGRRARALPPRRRRRAGHAAAQVGSVATRGPDRTTAVRCASDLAEDSKATLWPPKPNESFSAAGDRHLARLVAGRRRAGRRRGRRG